MLSRCSKALAKCFSMIDWIHMSRRITRYQMVSGDQERALQTSFAALGRAMNVSPA